MKHKHSYGDTVFLHSGKYISYIASFVSYEKDNKVKVRVDLAPERIIRTLILLESNISEYSYETERNLLMSYNS